MFKNRGIHVADVMINTFAGINVPIGRKEKVIDMCKAWTDMQTECLEQGMAEGRAEGKDLRDREMIAKKLRKGFSPEKIHEDDEYPMDLILEVQEQEIDAMNKFKEEERAEGKAEGYQNAYSTLTESLMLRNPSLSLEEAEAQAKELLKINE